MNAGTRRRNRRRMRECHRRAWSGHALAANARSLARGAHETLPAIMLNRRAGVHEAAIALTMPCRDACVAMPGRRFMMPIL